MTIRTRRFGNIIKNIKDTMNQVSLAVRVAGLVILSTAGFIGLGTMYYLFEKQNTDLLTKNNTYIELEKSVIALEGSLGTMQVLAQNGDKISAKVFGEKLKSLSDTVGEVRAANKVEALSGYIARIEEAVANASALAQKKPIDHKALGKLLEDADGTIGTLSYIATDGSQSEWQNLLAGKEANFIIISMLVTIASLVIGLLGWFTTKRINQVISRCDPH